MIEDIRDNYPSYYGGLIDEVLTDVFKTVINWIDDRTKGRLGWILRKLCPLMELRNILAGDISRYTSIKTLRGFEESFHVLMELEGGYVDDPDDKGGKTKFGITEKRYPGLDIGMITERYAKDLYKRDFWDKYKIEKLPVTVQAWAFDMYVNHNPKAVALVLQRSVNSKAGFAFLKVDGKLGEKTRIGLRKYTPEASRIAAFRMQYYNRIVETNPSQVKFLHGWFNRNTKLLMVTVTHKIGMA